MLKEPIYFEFNFKIKKPSRIPVVLSESEIEQFLHLFTNRKLKAIFKLIYSAILKVGELLDFKIEDFNSDRMQIRLHKGKGQKGRYSLLSQEVLVLLREYVMYRSGSSIHERMLVC